MSEDVSVSATGKSPEEVAFDLLNKLKGQGVWGERNISAILDMYAECLDAAKGLRAYDGQHRVDVPIIAQKVTPPQVQATATPAQVHNPAQNLAQSPAQNPTQAPQQPPLQQAVHAQQQRVQQAYKPAG